MLLRPDRPDNQSGQMVWAHPPGSGILPEIQKAPGYAGAGKSLHQTRG